jgi:hypothetical protein
LLVYLDEWNSICWNGGNRLEGGIDVFREKAVPVPLCSPPTQTDTMPGLERHWYKNAFSEQNQMCIAFHSEPIISIELLILVIHNEQDEMQFKMCSAYKRHEVIMKQILVRGKYRA